MIGEKKLKVWTIFERKKKPDVKLVSLYKMYHWEKEIESLDNFIRVVIM